MRKWLSKGMVCFLVGLWAGFWVLAITSGSLLAAEAVQANRLGMRFVKIPADSFMMGSHEAAAAVAANPDYSDC